MRQVKEKIKVDEGLYRGIPKEGAVSGSGN